MPEVDEKKEISSMELKARPEQSTATDASSASTITTSSPHSVKAQPPTSLNITVNHSINNSSVADTTYTSGIALNQTHTTKTSDNFSNIQVVSNCNSISENTAVINSADESVTVSEEAEVSEPLLVDGAKNSTNSNTNDYSGSEKDALIIISSN